MSKVLKFKRPTGEHSKDSTNELSVEDVFEAIEKRNKERAAKLKAERSKANTTLLRRLGK